MATSVNITVNDKEFTIACEEGQEARVKELGDYINNCVNNIGGSGANINESQLMVLTSLVLTDEIFDLRQKLEQAGAERAEAQMAAQQAQEAMEAANAAQAEVQAQPETNSIDLEREANIAISISEIADEVETLAKRLQSV